MPPGAPPRLLGVLLRRVLPVEWREDIARDMEELYRRRAGDGRWRADVWYGVQVGSFALRFGSEWVRTETQGWARRVREVGTMDVWRRIRLATRSLLRAPGFTLPAIGVLGLGLGAAATLFTVVDSVLLEPLPLPEARELVTLCEEHLQLEGMCIGSIATTRDLARGSNALVAGGVARNWGFNIDDWVGQETLRSGIADPGFFRAVGIEPQLGRLFADDEIGPDGDDVLVLSHALWVRRYGADPAVVGRTVRLEGEPAVIVGVLPEEFVVPTLDGIEAWRPLHVDPATREAREWRGFLALARLSPDVTLGAARQELGTMYRQLGQEHASIDDGWRLGVRTLHDQVVGDARPAIVALFGAVLLLLVIGCANVANLVLARAAGRRKELAIRAALGSGRAGVLSVIILESLLLAAGAAAIGVAVAFGGVHFFTTLAPSDLPRLEAVSVDGSVIAFVGLLSLATVSLFGLWPALGVSGSNPGQGLIHLRSVGDSRRGVALRRALVVAELALSTVLLFGSGLLVRTLGGFTSWDPGFDLEGAYVFSAFASPGTHPDREELMRFWSETEGALRALPGIETVSTASSVPLRGGRETTTYRAQGGEGIAAAALPSARWYDVGPGHFASLGVPVLDGREFTEGDDVTMPQTLLVNQTFARTAWPGDRALGRWVEIPLDDGGMLRFEVVGVVGDVAPITPGEPVEPEIYWSNRQLGRWGTLFIVRVRPGATEVAAQIRESLEGIDPTLSVGTVFTMDQLLERPLAAPRFNAVLGTVFAVLAGLLASVGLYAVLAYGVAREGRTIGLRMAMGASPPRVMRSVLTEAGALAFLGVALGSLGALASARAVRSLVHGVSPTDPLTLVGAAGLLVLVALAAAALPARRATRIDPSRLLRDG